MPRLANVSITAWRYGNDPGIIHFMVKDDQQHQRHCLTREGEALYAFLDARLREMGYTGPASERQAS